MNWIDIFDKYIRIITDKTDPYYALLVDQTEEDIVWSVIRKAGIDDGHFQSAHTVFDTWTIFNPAIQYKLKGTQVIYTNLIVG